MKFLQISILSFLLFFSCSRKNSTLAEGYGYLDVDNARLYYSTIGSGDTLVVLHGGPGLSHNYLKPQLDSLLSSDFTLLYYDQRGSGWSEGENDTTSLNMDSFVRDLEEVRRHFGLSEVNLLGHSFGGLLGMFYGIEHPSKLGSLVLVDSDAASFELRTPYQIKMIDSRLSEEQSAYLDSISESPAFMGYDPVSYTKYYKTFLTSYFANPKDTSKLSLGFDSINIKKIDATNSRVRKALGEYDIHDQLYRITCPTLILHGTESVFSVDGAKAIKNKIPHSELYLFENCGHFEYIESPAKFKKSVIDFYNKK
ncbi:MAG: alpha/beta fold hydrolase [Eudoraea sp.]|nr:alpha/beta fold hydrolase [Eudoraea sp.]